MRTNRSILLIKLLAPILVWAIGFNAGCSRWPPAVKSKAEIEALPVSQPEIRGIGIGDQELQIIADRFQDLDYLYLNSTSRVSDLGVSRLSKLVKLHQVIIEDGQYLTDQSISVLAGLPSIEELIVTNGPLLTDTSLVHLGRNPRLGLIHLQNCPKLSNSAKAAFLAAHPKCQIIF